MYALIQNDQIVQIGPLPTRWYDGDRWHDWRSDNPTTDPADYGWVPVVESPRPEDTAEVTHEMSVDLIDGTPTVTWAERPWTPEELEARYEADVAEQLAADTAADLTKLRDAIDVLATLLGNNTTEGSWRALRQQVSNQYDASVIRGIISQAITSDQATRRIARQTLRLARAMVGDFSSSDVGGE